MKTTKIVAFLLAFVSSTLKPQQDENVALDKKKQILAALNIRDIDGAEATEQYNKVITADMIINRDGTTIAKGEQGGTKTGFLCNSASTKEGKLALYVCNVDGETKYVIPVYGMGLWGSIWGYIALDADKNTIYGAYFDHQGETAGLGANCESDSFKNKFALDKGLQYPSSDEIPMFYKAGTTPKDEKGQIEAMSGATVTSRAIANAVKGILYYDKELRGAE